MKITVLAGGLSPERDVSLSSGSLIANALMDSGHLVALVDVYEGVASGCVAEFRNAGSGKKYSYTVPSSEPDLEEIRARNGNRKELVGPGVLELCRAADLVFIALHGAMGENGQLQAFLDVYAIPYTGSSFAGCLLAMDKDITKRLLVRENIPTAPWIMYDPKTDVTDRIFAEIGLPCAVKPCGCGSSVGVSLVKTEGELEKALVYAQKYESLVLVEKMIEGREFSVGILDGKALPPIEIIPKSGFYDYQNKYQGGMTEEICPARLSPDETGKVQELALAVHRSLHLGGYSRVDFILDFSGTFWCLEANTLPGMTPMSLLPQEAVAAGMSYGELCEKIARMAIC